MAVAREIDGTRTQHSHARAPSLSLCIKCYTTGPVRASHPAFGQAPKQGPPIRRGRDCIAEDAHPMGSPGVGKMVVR